MNTETSVPEKTSANNQDRQGTRRRIVLGIDPGVSTGLAALDIEGSFLFAESEREIGWKKIIDKVTRYGKVVLVATDVTPAPDLVRKVASTLDTALFVPNKSMDASEKRQLVGKYTRANDVIIDNDHASDALASAIKALGKFKNKFGKLESDYNELSDDLKQRTKELLIKGYSMNCAIRMSNEKMQPIRLEVLRLQRSKTEQGLQNALAEKSEVIARLNELTATLSEDIKTLKQENRELRDRLEKERTRSDIEVRKERIWKAQRDQIEGLTKQVHKLKRRLEEQDKEGHPDTVGPDNRDTDLVRLKPIKSFSSNGLEEAKAAHHIEPGDVVILRDASGGGASTARALAKLRPSLVITCTAMSDLAEKVLAQNNISVINSALLSTRNIDGNLFVRKKDLESVILQLRSIAERKASSIVEDAIEGYRD